MMAIIRSFVARLFVVFGPNDIIRISDQAWFSFATCLYFNNILVILSYYLIIEHIELQILTIGCLELFKNGDLLYIARFIFYRTTFSPYTCILTFFFRCKTQICCEQHITVLYIIFYKQ